MSATLMPSMDTAAPLSGVSHIEVPCGKQKQAEPVANFYMTVFGFSHVLRPIDGGSVQPSSSASLQDMRSDNIWLHHFGIGLTFHLVTSLEDTTVIAFVSKKLDVVADALEMQSIPFQRVGTDDSAELVLEDPAGNTVVVRTSGMFSQRSLASPSPRLVAEVQDTPRRGIAILTSGGDAQGMNAALRAVVRTGISLNCDVFAIHEGYEGLVQGGDYFRRLSWHDVSGILARGGTIIGTARSKEFRTREGRLKAAHNLISRGIDALVVIGGDGSLTGANIFRSEFTELTAALVADGRVAPEAAEKIGNLRVVGLVGSIDNDMCGTDMTIGADSALHRALFAIDALSSTAASHQRAFVVEIMGRNCGWLALYAAIACGADWLFIPECPSKKDDWAEDMCQTLKRHKQHGKRRLCVIVSEGAIDKEGKPIKSETVRAAIESNLKIETRVTVLGHVQRGGNATFFDRYMSTMQGAEAVRVLLDLGPDDPSPVITMNENNIERVPLVEAVAQTQEVAKALAAKDYDRAVRLRGTEFHDVLKTYLTSANAEPVSSAPACGHKFRFAIIHVGAPSGGVNAATRVLVRLGLSRGHTVFGVRDGFRGLVAGKFDELDWMSVDGWSDRGGSELGTNRHVPTTDIGMVAFQLQRFGIHGICIIGGFEALLAMEVLVNARATYPQFCIPIVHLPATISNNVPGTDFSLGSDTSLNRIVESCDLLRQSATSSKGRAFVVEVMGGECGYLATMGGLAAGASRVYIPEEGISLAMLAEDVEMIKYKFKKSDANGRIILRNEAASATYTTQMISSIFDEEGGKSDLFDCRTANLGHMQQGGVPSALDRVRGARLAAKCAEFLETQALCALGGAPDAFEIAVPAVYTKAEDSACVIGIRGARIALTPLRDAMADADIVGRRPRSQWWRRVLPVLRLLTSE